jgi:hypothetical protein
MEAALSLLLVTTFIAIINEPLELNIWDLMWRHIITMPTSTVWDTVYKWNFVVTSDKFNSARTASNRKLSQLQLDFMTACPWAKLHIIVGL